MRKNNSNNPTTNNNKTLLILIVQQKTVHILGCGHLTSDKRPNERLYDKQAVGRMKRLACRWFETFLFPRIISQRNSWAVQQARLRILVRPKYYINNVTNINRIDNKTNMK